MHIQLGTSFHAINPYVYSISLGVDAGESFCLAIVLGISESEEFYEMFYQAMHIVLQKRICGTDLQQTCRIFLWKSADKLSAFHFENWSHGKL
jgi:hypothetical protein